MSRRMWMSVTMLGCTALLLAFIPPVQASRTGALGSALITAPHPLAGCHCNPCHCNPCNCGKEALAVRSHKLCCGGGGDDGSGKGKLSAMKARDKDDDEGTDEGGDKGGDEGKLSVALRHLGEGCHKDKPTSQAAS